MHKSAIYLDKITLGASFHILFCMSVMKTSKLKKKTPENLLYPACKNYIKLNQAVHLCS